MERDNRQLLNVLWNRRSIKNNRAGRPDKDGKQQIIDNSISILNGATSFNAQRLTLLQEKPCKISTLSLDSRGRPQRSMRVKLNDESKKVNFRPYHLTWMAANETIPSNTLLQYSHRCHQPCCVEPTHGVWEIDIDNKNRNKCVNCSHVIFNNQLITLCPHNPTCLTPQMITNDDTRVVQLAAGTSIHHVLNNEPTIIELE
jgi:hypothetical protein